MYISAYLHTYSCMKYIRMYYMTVNVIHTYTRTYVQYVHVYEPHTVYIRMYVRTYVRIHSTDKQHIRTYIHTYNTYVCICICMYINAYSTCNTYVCTYSTWFNIPCTLHSYIRTYMYVRTFLKVLSMTSNFFASSGSWALMSPARNILSRYIHFLWTTIHTWQMKDVHVYIHMYVCMYVL